MNDTIYILKYYDIPYTIKHIYGGLKDLHFGEMHWFAFSEAWNKDVWGNCDADYTQLLGRIVLYFKRLS